MSHEDNPPHEIQFVWREGGEGKWRKKEEFLFTTHTREEGERERSVITIRLAGSVDAKVK